MSLSQVTSAARRRAIEEQERAEEERAARPARVFVMPKKLTAEEEAKQIFEKLGDLSGVKLFGNRILVAKFERSTLGSGFLIAAKETKTEDKWQGKIGLVVMKGTIAFQDDDATGMYWHGDNVQVGDWVWFDYSDGTDIDICPERTGENVRCKILKEGEVTGIVPRPDIFL